MATKLKEFSSQKAKEEKIKAETERLSAVLTNVHESKRNIAKGLIENIAFMSATLDDLQKVINSQGPVVHFEQGVQKMLVENPAQKSYSALVNRFTTAVGKLMDLLPKDLPDVIPNTNGSANNDAPKDALQAFHDKYKK